VSKRVRKRLYKIGELGSGDVYSTPVNDVDSLERGVVERICLMSDGTPTPIPRVGEFDKLEDYRKLVIRKVRDTPVISQQQFVDSYTGRKRRLYERAVASLAKLALSERDSRLRFFVKSDKTNYHLKYDPPGRIINPRDPRYNVELGRYIKPMEHALYSAIDEVWGLPTVLKGYDHKAMGRIMRRHWEEKPNHVAVSMDFSRMDQCIGVPALKYEHKFYNRKKDDYLQWLLGMQLRNVGGARAVDGFVRYKSSGMRCSGDMNTGLGNSIIATALFHEYRRQRGLHYSLINVGDDCVCFM
jgi:hypothetical protein